MNTDVSYRALFTEIKDLLSLDDEILGEDIGESDYAAILSLTEENIPDLKNLARLWLESPGNEKDQYIWDIAVFAWRAFASINITEAIRFMLELMDEAEKKEIQLDLLATDIEHAGEMADTGAMVFLCGFIQDKSYDEWTTISAIECLGYGLEDNYDMKNIVKDALTKRFMDYEDNPSSLNAFLIDHLADLKAVDLAEEIEKAFAVGKVDESHIGIWEDIRHRLGVSGMGLVPDGVRVTPDPYMELRGKLNQLLELNRAKEQQLMKKHKKTKKKQRNNAKKIRKMKHKGGR